MFVAEPRSRTRSGQCRANSDGVVADPLIKLINSGQVTRRRYGRQVNSNVGLETSWRYPARIRAITQDYTPNPPRVTRVLLYAERTIINALSGTPFRGLTGSRRNVASSVGSFYTPENCTVTCIDEHSRHG